ncbi:MAG: aldehyde dehydrogenase family protein [Candidatus Marinimicrobia bacterium]|nr:aldehyde dehydrogenase family protein [Candidatus Neomarinimicrobiota bacterium]
MTKILELINPTTGEMIRELPYHTWDEAKSLLITVGNTQKQWKHTKISDRIQLVKVAMDYFRDNQQTIAEDITRQMGKPISQSINEVKGMIHRAEVCCELAEDAIKDIIFPETDGLRRIIMREPLGVVLDIAAWNYPLLIAVNVVVPAILAGNSVAIKHSSLTPLCGIAFEAAFKSAGAPDGLVTSLILDHQTTEQVIQSGLIHHLAFTGSVAGGQRVKASIGSQFIEAGLELGGKDPAYIREDANLKTAIPGVMDGVFYNAGQSCCGVERIYVHNSIFHQFVDRAVEFMNNLIIGDPMYDTTDLGPLAQLSGLQTIQNQLFDAEEKGANIIRHPGPCHDGNNYLLPAILTNVNHNMEIMMEESFGPVVGIMAVNSDKEAIEFMNDSPYGLTASVWTENNEKAFEIGNQIETGTIFQNRCDVLDPELPWVGVKDSGKGCTLSALGIQGLTRPKAFNLLVHRNGV